MTENFDAAAIAEQNDKFRQTLQGGRVLLTTGVQAIPEETLHKVIQAIQVFDDFTPDNDPHEEHDFGEVEVEGNRVWWKIDAYDKNLEMGSPNPADPDVTTRVMTVLLPSEY